MKTFDSIAGGFETSEATSLSSRAVNADLDALETRLDEIEKDETRSEAEKAKFLEKFAPEAGRAGSDALRLIENNVGVSRKAYADSLADQPPLQPHIAVMLADALRQADPAKRVAMVNTDARYHGLLKDLGASYFDLSERSYQGMLEMSSNAIVNGAMSEEQREQYRYLGADEAQVTALRARKSALLKRIDRYIESNAKTPAADKRKQSDHLYKL